MLSGKEAFISKSLFSHLHMEGWVGGGGIVITSADLMY